MQEQPARQMDPLTAAISGQSFMSGETRLTFQTDGRLVGAGPVGDIRGAWTVRDGRLCRTLTAPQATAGTECQTAELREGGVAITRTDGVTLFWEQV